MSLHTALERLPGDRATESTVRDVLEYVRARPGQWLAGGDIAGGLDRSGSSVGAILTKLAEGQVLDSEDERFRYERDPIVELDIQRFLRRAQHHTQLVQDNLAKFRDRFGGR